MMVVVFAMTAVALVAAYFAPPRVAIGCMLVCLATAIGLFLSDVHNRDYGYGLPWLKVEADGPARTGGTL